MPPSKLDGSLHQAPPLLPASRRCTKNHDRAKPYRWLFGLRGVALAALLTPFVVAAADITVIGTAHLQQLKPRPTGPQVEIVIDALTSWRPSLICIEALPSDQVDIFLRDPIRHGVLLQTFGEDAASLASRQQVRLALDAAAARDAADALARTTGQLPPSDITRLVALHLAAHEPWSAALVWSAMNNEERVAGRSALGVEATAVLDRLIVSDNEIARIALPLARRMGHKRFCHADSFIDEVAVAGLADALTPMLQKPEVSRGIAVFNAESSRRWNSQSETGLLDLLIWMQSDAFTEADRVAQWDIFLGNEGKHHPGERRLALWQARNADISMRLFRAAADDQGERVLLLIGAAHRPFLESILSGQPYTQLVSSWSVLRSAGESP